MTYKEHFKAVLVVNNAHNLPIFKDFDEYYDVCDIYKVECDMCPITKECTQETRHNMWDTRYELDKTLQTWVCSEIDACNIPLTDISSLCNFEPKDERLPINNPSPVSHPLHYNAHNIEVIDFIQDWELNFTLGNAIKYICRSPYKGKQIEDIQKAIQYLEFELEDLIKKENKNK